MGLEDTINFCMELKLFVLTIIKLIFIHLGFHFNKSSKMQKFPHGKNVYWLQESTYQQIFFTTARRPFNSICSNWDAGFDLDR